MSASLTPLMPTTRSSKSGSGSTIQGGPRWASRDSIFVPVSSAVLPTTSSMSVRICLKSAVDSGWNTIAASPFDSSPRVSTSVSCAVDIAKSLSVGTGALSFFFPKTTSKRPTGGRLGRPLELRLEPLQRLDALLHRRVRGEEGADALADARGEDEEGVHLAGRPEVLLRDPVHAARDLLEGGDERARPARDERRRAVGRELPVARQGLHEHEGDGVD